MAIPGSVFTALKQAAPEKSDAELVALYDEVKKLSPQAATMDPMALARTIVNVSRSRPADTAAMQSNQVAAMQPAPAPQQVTITGQNPYSPLNAKPMIPQAPEISTELQSPYAGTAMMARNPEAPMAAQVGQFDPELLKAAYEDYARRYAATAGQRQLGQGLAAAAGPEALRASTESWNALDTQNKLMSLERQKAMQEQATSGLAAATTAQNINKTAGEYELSKAKGAQELAELRNKATLGGMDVLARQKLSKPGTTMAKVAFSMLQQQAAKTGQPLPPEVSPDTMSAEDMMPYMEPKLLKAFQDISTGRKSAAEANVAETVSGAVTKPGGTQVAPSVQAERDRARLPILQAELEKSTDPKERAGLQREILAITKTLNAGPSEIEKRLPYATVSGAGISLPPTPQTMAGAQAEGQAAAEAEKRFRAYDTELAPTLKVTRKTLETTGSGKGTQLIGAWLPGNDQQMLVNLLNRANAIYPGTLSSAVAPGMARSIAQGGFTGALVSGMTTEQVKAMIDLIEETARQDRAYQQRGNAAQGSTAPGQFGANQPMPSTKPRVTTREEYNQMKKGEVYTAPDGKQYIKGE